MKVEITRYKSNTKEDKHRKGKLKKCSVVLDSSDSWSVAWTLATIAAPLVKQLKETSHSYGSVPKELVPEHLHATYSADGYSEEAWKWALGEIEFIGYETTPEIKEVYNAYHARIKKGCELLGVLFQSLWD